MHSPVVQCPRTWFCFFAKKISAHTPLRESRCSRSPTRVFVYLSVFRDVFRYSWPTSERPNTPILLVDKRMPAFHQHHLQRMTSTSTAYLQHQHQRVFSTSGAYLQHRGNSSETEVVIRRGVSSAPTFMSVPSRNIKPCSVAGVKVCRQRLLPSPLAPKLVPLQNAPTR